MKTQINLRIDTETLERIDAAARTKGITRTAEMLSHYVDTEAQTGSRARPEVIRERVASEPLLVATTEPDVCTHPHARRSTTTGIKRCPDCLYVFH